MAAFSKYYDTIDEIIEHIRTALIGPVEENETIESDYPLSRYSLGILWGQAKPAKDNADAVNETENTRELFEDETQDNAWNVNISLLHWESHFPLFPEANWIFCFLMECIITQ